MDELIKYIEESVADQAFSRGEKRELKERLADYNPSTDDLNFLRSKVFDMAMGRATAENYELVIGWLEAVNKTLLPKADATSDSQVFFSPGEACKNAILHQLKVANSIVRICVFTISDNDIARQIIASHDQGLDVRVLTDNDKLMDMGSDIKELSSRGVPVKVDYTRNHMHHKFAVIDKETLLTGSYNWTRSAAKFNHENILLTTDKASVMAYVDEFDKLWKEMAFFHH